MAVELRVPEVGESITEVEISRWILKEGDTVRTDEPVVELESDKATVELPAPATGTISKIIKAEGETAGIGDLIGYMEEGEVAPAKKEKPAKKSADKPPSDKAPAQDAAPESAPEAAPEPPPSPGRKDKSGEAAVMPAARRVLTQAGKDTAGLTGTGPGGRVLKEDALRHAAAPPEPSRETRTVRMSPMRRTIAARLVEAQQNAALLTTFNEVDMTAVKQTRADLQESFQERHGVKLGFMSFFVKACVRALREMPSINSRIEGDAVVHHDYYDIGIAVGAGKGLVVPVLRNAEAMDFGKIERAIADFGARAKENKIALSELQGGTFTITNGGVYGSLLSTPIINPPQSGVLGMHGIQDRPVALDGQVVIRPMMYIALTYDHRIVDGREAVTFLKSVKDSIEKPALLFSW
jgi:2-oxoglutarate dehydrogenase E2 component (dihydrolipoamide succinyltransferase)